MGCSEDTITPGECDFFSRLMTTYIAYFDYNNLCNMKFKRRLYNENIKLAPLLKEKIDELIEKRNKSKPVEIAIGNCCRNPCYEYNPSLVTECPKCGGKVEESYENGCTVERRYDYHKGFYKNVTIYDDNVCDKFTFNDKINKEDYNLEELLKYFTKREQLEGEDFREYNYRW